MRMAMSTRAASESTRVSASVVACRYRGAAKQGLDTVDGRDNLRRAIPFPRNDGQRLAHLAVELRGCTGGHGRANEKGRSLDHVNPDDRRTVAHVGTAQGHVHRQEPCGAVVAFEQPFDGGGIEPRRQRVARVHDCEELVGRPRRVPLISARAATIGPGVTSIASVFASADRFLVTLAAMEASRYPSR